MDYAFQHIFDIGDRWLPLTALALGFQVVLKNLCLVTSNDSIKQVWFSLKTLNDFLTHLHVVVRLITIQQSCHQFCADFPRVYIFGDNLSSLLHILLPWYIRIVNRRLPHTNCFTHSILTSVLLVDCFFLLVPLFNSLVPLKKTRVRDIVFLHTLTEAPKISGLFVAWSTTFVSLSSLLNDLKKEGVNESMWKMQWLQRAKWYTILGDNLLIPFSPIVHKAHPILLFLNGPYIYIYIYIYNGTLAWWLECTPMARETWGRVMLKT